MATFAKGVVCVLMAGWVAMAGASSAAAQTVETQQVMREKLTRSQTLLAALVTSRWAVLASESTALDAVTMKPGWSVLQSPEYVRDTRAFNVAVQALRAAATERNQATALTAYNALVSSCVTCHRNVARRRLALLALPARSGAADAPAAPSATR